MSKIAEHRIGKPSPLIFHLGAALMGYHAEFSASTKAGTAGFPWMPGLNVQPTIPPPDLDPLLAEAQILERLEGMLSGLQKWQHHPYRRTISEPPAIWENGSSSLLDYGQTPEAADPEGPAVLVIPSLINRAYILDLESDNSLLRYLASQGLRPLLLDWGHPQVSERLFDLDTYVKERLIPAFETVKRLNVQPPAILGYCMGGTLAAGLVSNSNIGVSSLATIGAPWDFSGYHSTTSYRNRDTIEKASSALDAIGNSFGFIPTELFQYLFALIKPMQVTEKFQKFDKLDMNSTRAKYFVALEDWLADGVPMAVPAAKNVLIDWNLRNLQASGNWHLLGEQVDLANISTPALAVFGKRDTITPLNVAEPLAAGIKHCKVLTPESGHVGMITGSNAEKNVWSPLSSFFLKHGA